MTNQRVIVITGGGTGMGKSAALKFAELGDKVFILGRRQEKLEEVANTSSSISFVQTDVTNSDSIAVARDTILNEQASIDVLVNCAGGNVKLNPDATDQERREAWSQIIDINLTSVFLMIEEFGEYITQGHGRIINVTSTAALLGSPQPGVTGQAYSAAKSGVHGMTRTLVGKFASKGITINCIAPGVIGQTDFFPDGKVPDAISEYYVPRTPIGRTGYSEEVASGIVYLASEHASYITGEILNINGGLTFGR